MTLLDIFSHSQAQALGVSKSGYLERQHATYSSSSYTKEVNMYAYFGHFAVSRSAFEGKKAQ